MLPQIELDDERFADIMQQAKKQISEIYPVWTDYNDHDPGITMLELFAWLKEVQQFHMNQIGEEHLWAYLRLMGITRMRKRASEAVIRMGRMQKLQFFPRGSRFFAGDVCFEAAMPVYIGGTGIVKLSVRQPGEPGRAEHYPLREASAGMRIPAFGMRPVKGSALLIGMDGSLTAHVTHSLSVRVADREGRKQGIIGEKKDFYPLAEFSLEYWENGKKKCAEIVEDTTHQFLEDGFVSFRLDGEMTAGEDGLFWLQIVLGRCGYGAPPVLAGISLHEVTARQQRTVSQCRDGHLKAGETIRLTDYLAFTGKFLFFRRRGEQFFPYEGKVEKRLGDEEAVFSLPELAGHEEMDYRMVLYGEDVQEAVLIGEGSGLPYQEFEPALRGLCAGGLTLMTEMEKDSGCYVCASLCEDFSEAGAHDMVFSFREEDGKILFGDCDHGMAPEGKILLAAGVVSLGQEGNVKEGSICRFGEGAMQADAGMAGEFFVTNRYPAKGGRNTETLAESRERMLSGLGKTRRAVTYEDYERLVMDIPGLMIESVRAIPANKLRKQDGTVQEECVTLVVKPDSPEDKPVLSEAYRQNILRALEPARIIGTRIAVLSPEYIGISLFAEITASVQEEAARERIGEAAGTFFDDIRGDFGAAVRVSAIYGTLDVLDAVEKIVSLSLDAQGKDIRRSKNGDLILPANGLAYLKECVLNISTDR